MWQVLDVGEGHVALCSVLTGKGRWREEGRALQRASEVIEKPEGCKWFGCSVVALGGNSQNDISAFFSEAPATPSAPLLPLN